MSEKKIVYVKGMVWLGLVFLLAGGGIMLRSFTGEMANESTPRWVGFAAGLMFFNAGITVGLMDSGFNEYREAKWLAYLHGMALLSIPLIFTMLFNWVAFGSGEREFTMSISIPFLSFWSDRGNEIIGRIVFAIPALFMDLILLLVLYQMVAERFGLPVNWLENEEEKEDDE